MARLGDIDWDDLRCFLAAARAGSLAGAARSLGVEHTTIGRRLTALDEAMGTALLTRTPAGLHLTSAGQRVMPQVELMERAATLAAEAASSGAAVVRLAVPTAFGRYFNPHLREFQSQHPGVTLELLSGSRPLDLKKSEADLALRVGAIDDPDLVIRKIGEAGWALYASPLYLARRAAPADPTQLAGHELLGFEAALAGSPGALWIDQHGQGAQVVMRYRDMSDLLAACAAGLGLAVIPVMAAELEPSLQRLHPQLLGSRPLSLVYRREAMVAAPVRVVIDFVLQVMSPHAARMSGRMEREETK